MSGTIIENLSGKKLSVLVVLLIIAQITCFLIGGLVAPKPATNQNILGTPCKDSRVNGSSPDTSKWYYSRGIGACKPEDMHQFDVDSQYKAFQVVYTFQMPLPRNNMILDYSRWQQNLIGVLQVESIYHDEIHLASKIPMVLDARLAYRNKGDPDDAWKLYAISRIERYLECSIADEIEHYNYNCGMIPLFELGSLYHDYYLLNIRLPMEKAVNEGLGHITDLSLTVINQNGGFTKVWVSLKTIFFPIVICFMTWYWRRVNSMSRPPALLEYMLLALGSALTFLNLPLEYLTLSYDMPFMLLLSDIRQGVFYAVLLSFWLVFAGEHLMIQDGDQKNGLKCYWRHLSAVVVGCLSLFVFDMCERGVQLRNPFFSIWVTNIGAKLALSFIILAGISAGLYLLFLAYMILKVFRNINVKRCALPSMSSARRLHYEGVIYRFKFLMIATLLCASLTVVGFILGQVAEGQWKWDEELEIETTSAFFTGVYGMWNIYILALLCLYAPSHKKWPVEPTDQGLSEEIEFARSSSEPNEMLSLTAFARKTATE
ncbi:protein wntless [Fopius arisanus]|uniref:Protein wntless n=1 Tax=Fopius arisanus TaxID=64838 RepID=A0A0C9QG69_9HYME|nr:PREDICTED: protein wntless [Fopius arisanus]XP_011299908.1 PREDICTED: protein wntless [Fopius arisanus]